MNAGLLPICDPHYDPHRARPFYEGKNVYRMNDTNDNMNIEVPIHSHTIQIRLQDINQHIL